MNYGNKPNRELKIQKETGGRMSSIIQEIAFEVAFRHLLIKTDINQCFEGNVIIKLSYGNGITFHIAQRSL